MRLEICRKIRNIGASHRLTLVYYLTVSRVLVDETERSIYGIAVRISESGEETVVSGLTAARERALRLIDLLASNFVSPVALGDIVADWLE